MFIKYTYEYKNVEVEKKIWIYGVEIILTLTILGLNTPVCFKGGGHFLVSFPGKLILIYFIWMFFSKSSENLTEAFIFMQIIITLRFVVCFYSSLTKYYRRNQISNILNFVQGVQKLYHWHTECSNIWNVPC